MQPEVLRESAKPLEAIDSIKIVQVEGITQNGGGGTGNGGSSGNLATDAVAAALSYRAQAPVIDGLMKVFGLDGSSLDKLVSGGTAYHSTTVNDGDAPERKNIRIVKPKSGSAEVGEEESKA